MRQIYQFYKNGGVFYCIFDDFFPSKIFGNVLAGLFTALIPEFIVFN